jgi:hypothetical protein
MNQPAGHQGNEAVFAANSATRHRLVRATDAAGVALLAAWLIALALGVLGGFGALPGLPSSPSHNSSEASSHPHGTASRVAARADRPARAVKVDSAATGSTGGSSNQIRPRTSTPKATAPKVVQSPSISVSSASTTHGKAIGTTKVSGKPIGSPGNGPGGSGAPGRLR